MSPVERIKIILRYFQENASPEELASLNKSSNQPAGKRELVDYSKLWLWSAQMQEKSPQVCFDDTWGKIRSRQKKNRSVTILFRQAVRYAAVVLVLLNIGWWASRLFYDTENVAERREFLVTADQTANSVVILPDRTQVFLREGSSLRYGADFTSLSRQVYLEGEAYFEVTPDEKHPFTVKTEHADIEVLGTKFNVSAGPNICRTTLVEGKVVFRTGKGEQYPLLPNQMIEVDVNSKQVKIKDVNTELYTAWKEGKIIFRDETLGNITEKLEPIYHVEFIYQNPNLASEYRFSGTFHRETSIGDVITMLKLSIPMKVTREERFPYPDKIYLK